MYEFYMYYGSPPPLLISFQSHCQLVIYLPVNALHFMII